MTSHSKESWPNGSSGTKNKIVDMPCPNCPNAPHRGHEVGCPLSHMPVFEVVEVVPAHLLEEERERVTAAQVDVKTAQAALTAIRDEPITGSNPEWIAWAREVSATIVAALHREDG